MSIYADRWNAVHALFVDKILPAFDMPNVDVVFEGEKIIRDQLVIADGQITVKVENCTYCVYNGDPAYDEGAYDTEEVTAKNIRSLFKLYSTIPF